MRFDKLTIKSQEAVAEAQSLATGRGHSQITPSHLLRVLLEQPEGSTVPILQKIGIPIDGLQASLEEHLSQLPKVTGGAPNKLSKIKVVRLSIARVLTVISHNQKAALRKAYEGKQYIPIDLRAKKTRAIRKALTKEQKNKLTVKAAKKAAQFSPRKYAIKA